MFDARHKLKKHTREQNKGIFVKSPERKSPITESKTNIKNAIQTKKSSINMLL